VRHTLFPSRYDCLLAHVRFAHFNLQARTVLSKFGGTWIELFFQGKYSVEVGAFFRMSAEPSRPYENQTMRFDADFNLFYLLSTERRLGKTNDDVVFRL